MDQQIAVGVGRDPVAGFDDDCGVHLLDDRRPVEGCVDGQKIARIDCGFAPFAIEPDRPRRNAGFVERRRSALRIAQQGEVAWRPLALDIPSEPRSRRAGQACLLNAFFSRSATLMNG